ENISFKGKGITVTSSSGPETTIIDGSKAGSVVTFSSGENLTAVLNGFTIRNGKAELYSPTDGNGGGIRIIVSSPTVTNNKIIANAACTGAGIYIASGSPTVQGNIVSQNYQSGCSGGIGGGGMMLWGTGSAQILDNDISDNSMNYSSGGGISLNSAGNPTIKGNRINGNRVYDHGGGIYIVNQSTPFIVNNIITNNKVNEPTGSGGGIYLYAFGEGNSYLINNTIV